MPALIKAGGEGLVFLHSTPRAGSTLLAAMLGGHSQMLCPPEPWILLPLVAVRRQRLLAVTAYDHSLAQQAIAEALPAEVVEEAIAAYATVAYNALLAKSAKSIFVDKTPRYYHILPELDRIFPAARRIWLKRSPLDVIASCKETWQLSVAELMGEPLSPYTFDVTVAQALLSSHFVPSGTGCLSITYEDLVREPLREVAKVCEWLGLGFEPAMVEYGRQGALMDEYRKATMGDRKVLDFEAAHCRSIGRWAEILEPSEVERVLQALGTDVFQALGYEEELERGLAFASINRATISASGKLPDLLERWASYGEASAIEADGLPDRQDVHYALVAHRYHEALKAAEERLTTINRLDALSAELRSQLEAKERVVEELAVAAEERLTAINRLDALSAELRMELERRNG